MRGWVLGAGTGAGSGRAWWGEAGAGAKVLCCGLPRNTAHNTDIRPIRKAAAPHDPNPHPYPPYTTHPPACPPTMSKRSLQLLPGGMKGSYAKLIILAVYS